MWDVIIRYADIIEGIVIACVGGYSIIKLKNLAKKQDAYKIASEQERAKLDEYINKIEEFETKKKVVEVQFADQIKSINESIKSNFDILSSRNIEVDKLAHDSIREYYEASGKFLLFCSAIQLHFTEIKDIKDSFTKFKVRIRDYYLETALSGDLLSFYFSDDETLHVLSELNEFHSDLYHRSLTTLNKVIKISDSLTQDESITEEEVKEKTRISIEIIDAHLDKVNSDSLISLRLRNNMRDQLKKNLKYGVF